MMKTVRIISVICVVLVLSSAGAFAQEVERGAERTRSSQNRGPDFDGGDMEFGVILGEPTGLSFKTYTNFNTAIDLAVAWSFRDDGHLHIHGDYLFHNFRLFDIDEGDLPFYFGLGARVRFEDGDDDSKFGIRFVFGIEYYPENYPFGIFFEAVPILDLAPESEFDMNGGLGFRYLF